MHETCLIIIHDTGMRLGPGIEPGTFGLADECSTTELTLLLTGEGGGEGGGGGGGGGGGRELAFIVKLIAQAIQVPPTPSLPLPVLLAE